MRQIYGENMCFFNKIATKLRIFLSVLNCAGPRKEIDCDMGGNSDDRYRQIFALSYCAFPSFRLR